MKTFGTGEFKVLVEFHEGESELHLFMTRDSRKRFFDANKGDKKIKRMSRDPK